LGVSKSVDISKIKSLVGEEIAKDLVFEELNLELYYNDVPTSARITNSTEYPCIPTSKEVYAVSRFFRFDAPERLSSMGYDWSLRVDDNGKLERRLGYDVFEKMRWESKKYGFINAIRDYPHCIGDMWERATALCGSQCSKMMIGNWPRGVLMMSSFEVSHISVWRSDVCKGIRQSLVADTLGTQIYTDALIHTVCALASTKPTEMIKFDMKEIPYESILDVATTHKVMFEAKGVSNATRDSGVYATKPLVPAYEDQFSVRDFGWMGADIISSFGFPSIADVNHDLHSSSSKDTRHRRAMPSHYVWLFGDSLIGTANEMRRLGGSIISNTVGLAHMNYTNTVGLKSDKVGNVSAISRIDFHWGSNDDGSAKPLFKSIDSIIRNTTYPFAADAAERRDNIERAYYMPAFWPYSGVTVIKRTSATDLTVMADNVRLVVLGQYILSAHATGLQGILATANPSLSFREVCSAIFVVDNPYAPPGQWQYAHTVIPTPKWGQYRW
jgi:hypothetical protein